MSHRDPMVCIYHMHDHTQEVLEMVKKPISDGSGYRQNAEPSVGAVGRDYR